MKKHEIPWDLVDHFECDKMSKKSMMTFETMNETGLNCTVRKNVVIRLLFLHINKSGCVSVLCYYVCAFTECIVS